MYILSRAAAATTCIYGPGRPRSERETSYQRKFLEASMAEICAVRTIASRAEHDDVLPSADCDDDGGRGGRDRCRRSASPRAVQSCSAAAAVEGPSAAAAANSGGGGADVDRTRSSGVVRPAATASSAATSVSELAASSLRTADTPEVHFV